MNFCTPYELRSRPTRSAADPWKRGLFIVKDRGVGYVCSPPGWYLRSDGRHQYDGSAGPEHSSEHSKAYNFSKRNAAVVAANCAGKVLDHLAGRSNA